MSAGQRGREAGEGRTARARWGAGARPRRGEAAAHMCSSCCCFWSANVVCFCRRRELSLGVLRPWMLADLADAKLCKSFSLGRFGMVETGLDSRCSAGEASFALRLASKRADSFSLLNRLSSLSLLVRLSRARLWWNIAPRRYTLRPLREATFSWPRRRQQAGAVSTTFSILSNSRWKERLPRSWHAGAPPACPQPPVSRASRRWKPGWRWPGGTSHHS